jgi:hypothetical protein
MKRPAGVSPAGSSGGPLKRRRQAAFALLFATWLEIASIKAGDRQS